MNDIKLPLEQAVYSEEAILELMGVDKRILDFLWRERGLPAVRLTTRARVYLADEVLAWLKQRSRN